MTYDYIAKFATDIEIFLFNSILDQMCPDFSVPLANSTIETKANVTAGSLLDEERKKEFCRIQNEEYRKSLENKDFWVKTGRKIKVGETRFLGYEEVSEHIEKENN